MENTDADGTKKNLISRRTWLNRGILTGISLAAGSLMNISFTTDQKLTLKKGSKNSSKKAGRLQKDTYIDNFDC